jgi:hypothetical protein
VANAGDRGGFRKEGSRDGAADTPGRLQPHQRLTRLSLPWRVPQEPDGSRLLGEQGAPVHADRHRGPFPPQQLNAHNGTLAGRKHLGVVEEKLPPELPPDWQGRGGKNRHD